MSNNWSDWQQNKRIEAAEEQLAAERRARSRLSEQMRSQQGNLQGQIDRLTRAFVALIEHEDIRAELGQHADAAGCRRYAREVVATVIVTGGAALRGVGEPVDVPGYWLSAAARGVAAIARGDQGGEALLTEARHRDRQRTALFLCLLSAQTTDPRWATGQLDDVLPKDPASITAAQRQLWLAIAEGRLAPTDADATGRLTAALDALVAADPERETKVIAWLNAQTDRQTQQLDAERAAAQLAALRRVLTTDQRGPEPAEPAEPELSQAAEDPMADCLRSLVDHGSPAEGDILDRMAQARKELGFLDEKAANMTAAWTEPVGSALELLLLDLGAPPDSPRFELARRVLAPQLRDLAEKRAGEAATPPESRRVVRVAGVDISVGTAGAAQAWQPAVTDGVLARQPVNPLLQPLGLGLVALGAVLLVLGFVAGGFVVAGIFALLGGAGALVAAARGRAERRRSVTSTLSSAERQVTDTAAALADEQSRCASAAGTAQADLGVIRQRIG